MKKRAGTRAKKKIVGYVVRARKIPVYYAVGPANQPASFDTADRADIYVWAKRAGAESWIRARSHSLWGAVPAYYRVIPIVKRAA